ncbi:MAG: cysteine--tRNA ligase [Dissulfuribacterales bacterium]
MPPTSILEKIGNTPLIPITRLNPYKNVQIWAKMESFNPGGSIKDRIALAMIQGAERRGELTKQKIVAEASSGNTGIGLAMVCAVKGYRCLIAMSEAASIERRQIIQAFGAEILLTPAKQGTDGAIEAVYNLGRAYPDRYFLTDQFNNPDNWMSHYNGTALEIWEQTRGKITSIVATMGTTGTLMGITRRMRELNSTIRMVGMEPYLGHKIQGLKNMKESYKPGIYDKNLPDTILNIHDEEAFEYTRRLAREEGLFVGMSSGAAFAAAIQEAARLKEGLIVVIFPDGGERYLSTGLFAISQKKETQQQKGGLRFYNSMSRKKEKFEALDAKKCIGMYSCGPTAYEETHLGLCRRVLVSDLIQRVLEFRGFEVVHVMNITDIDDKTIGEAIANKTSLSELTQKYIQKFMDALAALRVKPATFYPKASEHVEGMLEITRNLLKTGHAYVKHGSVYFDISKLPNYGSLSRIDRTGLDIGCTVDLDNYEKDNPSDFTLFKRVTLQELKFGIGFQTEWGQVRPGLHIECVAMSRKYLGDTFDIHTSDKSLMFPHHENEIAIAMALTGKPLARYWLHSDLVYWKGKKISRANDNIITLRELLQQGWSGREIRFFLLKTHYRKPIHYSCNAMEESVRLLRKIDEFWYAIVLGSHQEGEQDQRIPTENTEGEKISRLLSGMREEFISAMEDDLNVANAITAILKLIKEVHLIRRERGLTDEEKKTISTLMLEMDSILGILDTRVLDSSYLSEEAKNLFNQREQAKKAKNWPMADRLRDKLQRLGFHVIDTLEGSYCVPHATAHQCD